MLGCNGFVVVIRWSPVDVFQVTATDPNRGQNGKLEYSITSIKELGDSQEKNYFRINSTTGKKHTGVPKYKNTGKTNRCTKTQVKPKGVQKYKNTEKTHRCTEVQKHR